MAKWQSSMEMLKNTHLGSLITHQVWMPLKCNKHLRVWSVISEACNGSKNLTSHWKIWTQPALPPKTPLLSSSTKYSKHQPIRQVVIWIHISENMMFKLTIMCNTRIKRRVKRWELVKMTMMMMMIDVLPLLAMRKMKTKISKSQTLFSRMMVFKTTITNLKITNMIRLRKISTNIYWQTEKMNTLIALIGEGVIFRGTMLPLMSRYVKVRLESVTMLMEHLWWRKTHLLLQRLTAATTKICNSPSASKAKMKTTSLTKTSCIWPT